MIGPLRLLAAAVGAIVEGALSRRHPRRAVIYPTHDPDEGVYDRRGLPLY